MLGKKRSLLVKAAIVAGSVLLPIQAVAGLQFCNKTDQTVYVAVVESRTFACLVELELCREFVNKVEGWWTIKPGACKTAIGEALRKNVVYLYFATGGKGRIWSGDRSYCVDPKLAFRLLNETAFECDESVKRKFKVIRNSSETTDYTMDLTT